MITTAKADYSKGFRVGKIHFIAGFPKSGKTTAISTYGKKGFGSVVILDLEDGTEYTQRANRILIGSLEEPTRINSNGDHEIIPPIERGSVDEYGEPIASYSLIEAIEYLEANWDSLGYDSIAIDTIDQLNQWFNDYVVSLLIEKDALSKNPQYQDATDIGDFDFSVGYSKVRKKIVDVLTRLANIVKKTGIVICASHLNKTISVRDGKNVVPQKLPSLPEKLAQTIAGMSDVICILTKVDANRYEATFEGTGESFVGTRIKPLNGKKIIFKPIGDKTLYNQMITLMKNYKEQEDQKENDNG